MCTTEIQAMLFFGLQKSSRFHITGLNWPVINQQTNGGLPIIIEFQWGEWITLWCDTDTWADSFLMIHEQNGLCQYRRAREFSTKAHVDLGTHLPRDFYKHPSVTAKPGFLSRHTLSTHSYSLQTTSAELQRAARSLSVALDKYHFQQYCFTKQAMMLLDK